jgi:hypothetical protein
LNARPVGLVWKANKSSIFITYCIIVLLEEIRKAAQ